jgi:hypothetical protein
MGIIDLASSSSSSSRLMKHAADVTAQRKPGAIRVWSNRQRLPVKYIYLTRVKNFAWSNVAAEPKAMVGPTLLPHSGPGMV